MKLTKEIIDKIQIITQIAQLVGIDSVIIEKDMVRGIDDEKTVTIFHGDDNDLPFGAIALNRLSTFMSRLDLASAGDGFEIEATTDEAGEYAKSLTMKNKKSKVEFRCANPTVVKAPKQIQDTMKFEITLSPQDVNILSKAFAAMGSELIEIRAAKETAEFKMMDINKDEFSHDITGSIKSADGSKVTSFTFNHKYPTKVLLSLFKKNPEGSFSIGVNGLLNIKVNDITLYVLPQV